MKKIALFFVGTAALFTACDENEEIFGIPGEGNFSGEEVVVDGYHHELTASVANENPASRAGFDLTDGTFHWLGGDDISVMNENNQFAKYTLKTGEGTASATFQTDAQIGTPQGYALHPHSASHNFDGTTLTFNLPESYSYTHAAEEYGVAPMVAAFEVGEENLQFKHVGGVFCFQVVGVPAGTTWFKFAANAQITGTFGVTEEDGNQIIKLNGGAASSVTINIPSSTEARDLTFYIPVPTGTYNGFTISVGNAGETTWSYTSVATNTVNRKSLKKMPKINLSASTAEAVADVFTNGGILTLADDVELESSLTLPKGKSVTIDLNGKTLSLETTATGAMINNKGNLTLTGGAISYNFNGSITGTGVGVYAVSNTGTLVVEGTVIENTTLKSNATVTYAIDNNSSANDATIIIKEGAKIISTDNYAIRQFANGNKNSVTIEGGLIQAKYRTIWIQLPGTDTSKAPEVNLTIKGGKLEAIDGGSGYVETICARSSGNNMKNVIIDISGGEFYGNVALTGGSNKTNIETLNISGGTFIGYEDVEHCFNVYSYGNKEKAAQTISITGGTFSALTPTVSTEYRPDTYIGTEGTADANYELVDNGDGTRSVQLKSGN